MDQTIPLDEWLEQLFYELKMARDIEVSAERSKYFYSKLLSEEGFYREKAWVWIIYGDWSSHQTRLELPDFFPTMEQIQSVADRKSYRILTIDQIEQVKEYARYIRFNELETEVNELRQQILELENSRLETNLKLEVAIKDSEILELRTENEKLRKKLELYTGKSVVDIVPPTPGATQVRIPYEQVLQEIQSTIANNNED
jgi:polyhydroxyalkanoate synthesis regulator phasin